MVAEILLVEPYLLDGAEGFVLALLAGVRYAWEPAARPAASTACGASTGQRLDPPEGLDATALSRGDENDKGAGLN